MIYSIFCNGIFHSKISYYCIHVWNLSTLDDEAQRFHAFTKSDNKKLQILHNKTMRLKMHHLPFHTSTEMLCSASGDFSVQQLTAFSTLVSAKKNMFHKQNHRGRATHSELTPNSTQLRDGYFYSSAKVFNKLPDHLRSPLELNTLHSIQCIKENFSVKPG